MKHAVRIVAVWGWEYPQERTKCCMWAPYCKCSACEPYSYNF